MTSGEESRIGPASEPDHANALALLMEGISAYLREIDSYRAVCRRHEGTAIVDERAGDVRVGRSFESSRRTLGHLKSAMQLLPRSYGDAPRRSGHDRYGRHPQSLARIVKHDLPCLLQCAVVWEGRRHIVHARRRTSPAVLSVDLFISPLESGLPELPLRTVAMALRCHEFLVPDIIALPLAVRPDEKHGVREYLKRAIPPNLSASQCI